MVHAAAQAETKILALLGMTGMFFAM